MKRYIVGGVILAAIAAFLIFTSRNTASAALPAPSNRTSSTGGSSAASTGQTKTLKDGTFTGAEFGAVYGPLQVAAVVEGGKLTDVKLLAYPDDPGETTVVNQGALPQLVQEAITAQNAQVDIVSGATQTSQAFQESLGSALSQAM